MTTKALRTGLLGAATAVAIFAFPSVSNAEYFIPPGNSAVNQYTESVPTAGGHRNVGENGNGGSTPAKVLGKGNAKRLESQGETGRKAAEVAAETAPSPIPADSAEEEQESTGTGGAGGNDGGGQGSGGGSSANHHHAATDNHPAGGQVVVENRDGSADINGSSGLGEVLGQATGSSSGEMGLLLPLALLAALLWAALMFRRQRSRTAP